MPNNRLILRNVKSPWVITPLDITKNSVLSWGDVDNNFIYLKGESLSSAEFDGGVLKLNKVNGNSINVEINASSSSTEDYIFVSLDGDDNNDGTRNKPLRNLYIARDMAEPGQTVYVLPGEWVFDNTIENGSPYNGNVNYLVNLWKNGVTYYFSAGVKIKFKNQRGLSTMNLFRPHGNGFEECKVFGYLDFYGEQVNGGAGGNGMTFFFDKNEINAGTSLGYKFDCEVHKVIATMPPINSKRSNTLGGIPMYFNFKCDEYRMEYKELGTTWDSGVAYQFRGDSLQYETLDIGYMSGNYTACIGIEKNYNPNSRLVMKINKLETFWEGFGGWSLGPWPYNITAILVNESSNRNVTIDINECHFTTKLISIGHQVTSKLNINGNVFEQKTDSPNELLSVATSGGVWSSGTIKLKGDIYHRSNSNTFTNHSSNVIMIEGNINYIGSTPNTNNIFDVQGGRIEFTGGIYGNFNGSIGRVRNTTLRIYNSNIRPSGSGGRLLNNNTTSSGVFALDNSKVIINSGGDNLINGNRVGVSINNSLVYNTSSVSGSTVYENTLTNNGTLYLNNTTLYSNYDGDTIESTSQVVSNNSTVNRLDNIPTGFDGEITINENINSF